jgi:hypothetical protein
MEIPGEVLLRLEFPRHPLPGLLHRQNGRQTRHNDHLTADPCFGQRLGQVDHPDALTDVLTVVSDLAAVDLASLLREEDHLSRFVL